MKQLAFYAVLGLAGGILGAAYFGDVLGAIFPDSGADHGPWYASRAAGMASYFMLWLAAIIGTLMSSAWFDGIVNRGRLLAMHQASSYGGLLLGLGHALVLIPDEWTQFGMVDLFVPFASYFEPTGTALGTLALYLFALVTFSFWIRGSIGTPVWRAIHFTSFIALAGAFWHGMALGTDATEAWALPLYIVTSALLVVAVVVRLTYLKPKPVRKPRPAAAKAPAGAAAAKAPAAAAAAAKPEPAAKAPAGAATAAKPEPAAKAPAAAATAAKPEPAAKAAAAVTSPAEAAADAPKPVAAKAAAPASATTPEPAPAAKTAVEEATAEEPSVPAKPAAAPAKATGAAPPVAAAASENGKHPNHEPLGPEHWKHDTREALGAIMAEMRAHVLADVLDEMREEVISEVLETLRTEGLDALRASIRPNGASRNGSGPSPGRDVPARPAAEAQPAGTPDARERWAPPAVASPPEAPATPPLQRSSRRRRRHDGADWRPGRRDRVQ